MSYPPRHDPLVIAAREAFEREWERLGRPERQIGVTHPELEAARRVYRAVLTEAEARYRERGKLKVVSGASY